MVPYLTRRDVLGGLFAVAVVASVLAVSVIPSRDASCMDVIAEHRDMANRFQDELAGASLAGSQAECTAHRAYFAELEALDARSPVCSPRGPNKSGRAPVYGTDLALQRRLIASKCSQLQVEQ